MTQPTEYVIGFCAGLSTVVYVYRQVQGFVVERKVKPDAQVSVAELRRLQNREDLRDIMNPYLKTQTEALASLKESLSKLTYIAERYWK